MSVNVTGSATRLVVLMRIGTTPVLRLCSAFGEFAVPGNALDAGEETYLGLSSMVEIPVVEQLMNGVSARGEFTLAGLTAEVAALAEADAPNVEGAQVNLGLVFLDSSQQPTGTVFWLWDGIADRLSASKEAGADGEEIYLVKLSVAAAHANRARPEFAFWTDAQHQRAHPGDLFFNQVPSGEAQKRWPA